MIGRTEIARYEPGEYNPPAEHGEVAAREYLARRQSYRAPRSDRPTGAMVGVVLLLLTCALGLVLDGDGCRRADDSMEAS